MSRRSHHEKRDEILHRRLLQPALVGTGLEDASAAAAGSRDRRLASNLASSSGIPFGAPAAVADRIFDRHLLRGRPPRNTTWTALAIERLAGSR